MRTNNMKATLKAAVRVVGTLSFAALVASGATPQQVNLSAGPAAAILPDGTSVPMWGYSCGAAVGGSTAKCAALNQAPVAGNTWSPVEITVPTGAVLQINLTNNLSFGASTIPTSLVIVGQLGGGLGNSGTTMPSPTHADPYVTWSTVGTAAAGGATFTPPTPQPGRVQSFSTEVLVGGAPANGQLTWPALRPGTYLLESGTHPSIQGPMGLYGIVVVTAAPGATAGVETSAGTAYPGVTYDAEVPLLLSEIDPVQNSAVNAAVNTVGFGETNVWSGQPNGCGNPSSSNYQTCYPPAVNYSPLYYLFNGVAFSKTNSSASLFPASPGTLTPASGTGTATGSVLVRLVNAGLRMHVPSIVGSQTIGEKADGTSTTVAGFSLIAEDGNPLPGVARVQSEVFLAAGKTYDVMINGIPSSSKALAIFDRELSLSGNAVSRDAGMLAYIGINGAGLPTAAVATATARPDTYNAVIGGQTLTVSDASKGVIANDSNVFGVKLIGAGVTSNGASTTLASTKGTLTLSTNGSFTYVPNAGFTGTDVFTYQANGSGPTTTITFGGATMEVAGGITMAGTTYTSNVATYISIKPPGVLAFDSDAAGYPLTVAKSTITGMALCTSTPTPPCLNMDTNGGFNALVSGAGSQSFSYRAQNSQGTLSSTSATINLVFPTGSGLAVTVVDGKDWANNKTTKITDYRWIIEEDRTFYVDPTKTQNSGGSTIVPTFGTNFHTSDMPYVAQGCTGVKSCEGGQMVFDPTSGNHVKAVCDIGNGVCRPDSAGNGLTAVDPKQVYLDPTKRYYISVLPGDAADPFYGANAVGHGMGGAPITLDPYNGYKQATAVTVISQPSPYPPSKLSVFVFEDDFPLNGEQDAGGGVDVLAPNEPGLGGFQIHLWDAMGGNGDFTGQMTYDMFNQPLSNSLAGTIDPATKNDACPISPGSSTSFNGSSVSASATTAGNTITITGLTVDPSQQGNTLVIQAGGSGFTPGTYTITGVNTATNSWTLTPAIPGATAAAAGASGLTGSRTQPGITGMIVTCPKYESDGTTLSPLAGQAVIANLMPGRFGVVATPAADRIAKGEEWLQTNTLDGQKAHDSFVRIGEPSYFQEFGPAGYHVTIGFANPAIINARLAGVCAGTDINLPDAGQCSASNVITGQIVGERLSRTPDERLYGSGSYDAYYWTQCYVSVGDPDGEDFAFTKCDDKGNFTISGIPAGTWRVTTFDQWNDMLVDGLSTPVSVTLGKTVNMGQVATTQWQTNLYTTTFIDDNKDGLLASDEAGVPLVNVAVRLRDGSLENLLATDFTGTANFNETFPLFSWYVVETDVTRYKNTGTHVVYDVGGPADQSPSCGQTGYPPCGSSTIGKYLANTAEKVSVPTELRIPGAVYCANADCSGYTMLNTATNAASASAAPSVCTSDTSGNITCSTTLSSGRIDPPWVGVEGWQGFPGQNSFIHFGKAPYASGENGGIQGHVVYASTRPFDDPQMLVQTQWEPLIPHVTINLYQEGTATDGVTPTLKLVDFTATTSFDDFAQGFRALDGKPNMSCPGQTRDTGLSPDLFFFTLYRQPNYLNAYNAAHGGSPLASPPLPYDSQFKCYDGMHNWNQIQPVPYDGMYKFPSVTAVDANGKPTATNCTGCIADPATTTPTVNGKPDPNYDPYRHGLPMLPKGKYVVEVVLPPGYELVKEEDKNILIGDNYIAPVTQQFGGLGNVFILPDQAAVASSYNANNAQNSTTDLGAVPRSEAVPGFVPEPVWPCVGQSRIVPDYISLFPQSLQISPFAGATRNLCDRKEVTLSDQMGAIAKFYLYTSTHKAAKFTGGITDDFTSEFDPFSPQFGEKFAPPDLPVAVKDWTGAEISRVYADQWGAYNGMTYSTWEVNPPNPTGYAPSMMVFCMNDRGTGTAPDPLFNPGYSQFCYELPFMPGTTQYLDTPVVPTSAFSEGYNHPDCAEPALTPAISRVDGDGAQGGPYVSAAGKTLTITALGDQTVTNYGYTGPAATTAPYNEKTIPRHYGFGTQCTTPTVGNSTCNTLSSVTIGGKTATITGWSDTSIKVTVPSTVPACAVQQQAQYGGSTAQCGQLTITAGNGMQSIDAVTVTVGGKAPTYVTHTADLSPTSPGSIQQAIDAAQPGDLLIVLPGDYQEMLVMWKPVRLQGVGAASSIIDANTQPGGKLDPWRAYVSCFFGLSRNGQPFTGGVGAAGNIPTTANSNPFDTTSAFECGATGATNWVGFSGKLNNPQVDRLPLEGILGWDTTVNGNLAQLLQEPTLMGAYEGAGITVLSKGVNVPSNAVTSYYGSGSEASFPTGTALLSSTTTGAGAAGPNAGDCGKGGGTSGVTLVANPYPSNFQCNPSSIDGLTITDASQGGGGIFAHAWAHNLQVANNRVLGNIGTLSGGINIGQGESPDIYSAGTAADSDPGSCRNNPLDPVGLELPYCFDLNVNVHNNYVINNTSIGDELFSGTPAGAGGVSFCTGADYYKFNYNWVCGNMSTGDGGGMAHIGFIWNGDIEHNTVIFNQSLNPTIATNGGGILVMGAAPDGFAAGGIECGSTAADADCAPGLPDGTGPGLVINANLILGNAAESGSGGGLRLQSVNGTEINSFTGSTNGSGTVRIDGVTVPNWNTVAVTNNLIVNNVAGWDGGGVSLQDALAVNMINNTIASNDSTASSGVLFNTLGSPLASAPGATNQCPTAKCGTVSQPQPGGLVAIGNSPNLIGSFAGLHITCPTNHPHCTSLSFPYLANDVFWQNRSFYIGVGQLSAQFQQNVISLYNSFTTTQAPSQPQADATTAHGNGVTITGGTGACPAASYWDIGVRGDMTVHGHESTFTLSPTYSVLTDNTGYSGTNMTSNPNFLSQYCNGSRIPPEAAATSGGTGWQVPPGISDATVPNPIFNLTPAATVDEGNNWVNMQWGPLALSNPVTQTATNFIRLGNYAPASGSPVIDAIPTTAPTYNVSGTLATDFFGNPRPDLKSTAVDIGAIEYQSPAAGAPIASVTGTGVPPGPLAFGSVPINSPGSTLTLTLHNTGSADLTGITVTTAAPYSRAGGTCTTTLTVATGTCTILVNFAPTALGVANGTLSITANVAVTNAPVSLSGTGVARAVAATLTTTPSPWTPSQARNCPGTGLGIANCLADPSRAFTLTNTGNVTLTGIAQAALSGANVADYTIVRALSTCGPTGNGQLVANITLAPGATCNVQVQFKPLTAEAAGAKTVTVSVTDAASTSPQSVTITGTAN